MSGSDPATRAPIRRLDEETVRQIAAGEVVERPASVVKELVENAVDAGASEVTVGLEEGGLETIEVADDGIGIPAFELTLALERHATSKLPSPAALESISTLGFRGEALAAIASVSRLRLVSRTPDRESAVGVSVVAGSVVGEFVQARAPGTTVEVRDLFFNTPARRKFLKSAAAEQVEVAQTLERLYLARPTVGLTFRAQGQEVARYPASAGVSDAAARVLGAEFLAVSVPFRAPEDAGVDVVGVVARPELSRPTSSGIFLAVNGRTVVSKTLTQAVRLAFHDYLPKNRFPVAVVHLSVDPDRVDVNVHPTKREVRLAGERDIADRLRRIVRGALIASPHTAGAPESRAPVVVRIPERRLIPSLPAGALEAAGASARTQQTLEPVPEPSVEGTARHPSLRLLGSLFHLYWFAESDGDLVLVDQHAASERVLFDALRREGRLGRQELVEPVVVELTSPQAQAISGQAEVVRSAGFEVEPFGGTKWRVRSVPAYRGRRARPEALVGLLDELLDGGRPTSPNGTAERVWATISCHAAVRAGDVISAEEMGRILESLYRLPEGGYACPHGRPILVQIPRSRLDRWFLRREP